MQRYRWKYANIRLEDGNDASSPSIVRSITIVLHVFHAVPRAASMSRIVLTRPGEARAAIHSMFGFAIGHNSAIRWNLSQKKIPRKCLPAYFPPRKANISKGNVFIFDSAALVEWARWIFVLFSLAKTSKSIRIICFERFDKRIVIRIWISDRKIALGSYSIFFETKVIKTL